MRGKVGQRQEPRLPRRQRFTMLRCCCCAEAKVSGNFRPAHLPRKSSSRGREGVAGCQQAAPNLSEETPHGNAGGCLYRSDQPTLVRLVFWLRTGLRLCCGLWLVWTLPEAAARTCAWHPGVTSSPGPNPVRYLSTNTTQDCTMCVYSNKPLNIRKIWMDPGVVVCLSIWNGTATMDGAKWHTVDLKIQMHLHKTVKIQIYLYTFIYINNNIITPRQFPQ